MLGSTEKLDLDARMNDLPPEQRGIGREIYERNKAGAPPPGMTVRETANTSAANTGPKGVKADFEEAKKNLRSQRMMDRLRRERAIQGQIRVQEFVQDEKAEPVKKPAKREDEVWCSQR